MIPTCCTLGRHLPAFSLQASNDERVQQHSDAGEDSFVPPFITAIARAVSDLLSRIVPPQRDLGVQGASDRRDAAVGSSIDSHRNASQPLLRAPEASASAYGSVDRQIDTADSETPQGLAPPSDKLASPFTGSPLVGRSSDPCTAKAALDEAYRSDLEAWVASSTQTGFGSYYLWVQGKINDYLRSPERHNWTLDFSNMRIATLPPLPADLKSLIVSNTELRTLAEDLPRGLLTLDVTDCLGLRALPEDLPQGLQTLYVRQTGLSSLPKNLPEGLQHLYARGTRLSGLPMHLPRGLLKLEVCVPTLRALPENLPQGLLTLEVSAPTLRALPNNLPQGLLTLDVSDSMLSALPEEMPPGLQHLCVWSTELSALPKNLPQGLLTLKVYASRLSALPKDLPQGLQHLYVSAYWLCALPEDLPWGLQHLYVSAPTLSALPKNLPRDLLTLRVHASELNALPENLPPGLLELNVRNCSGLTALPKKLPQGLQELNVDCTELIDEEALLAILKTNISITNLSCRRVFRDMDIRSQRIREALESNKKARRLPYAAASLDLLTRYAFATDQTGTLINRTSTPNPVAGRLPLASIPAELHDVLAANCPPDVLKTLARMAGDSQ